MNHTDENSNSSNSGNLNSQPLTRTQQKLFLQRDFSLSEEQKYDVKAFDKILRIYTNISWQSKPVEESWERIMQAVCDVDQVEGEGSIIDSHTGEIAEGFLKYLASFD